MFALILIFMKSGGNATAISKKALAHSTKKWNEIKRQIDCWMTMYITTKPNQQGTITTFFSSIKSIDYMSV